MTFGRKEGLAVDGWRDSPFRAALVSLHSFSPVHVSACGERDNGVGTARRMESEDRATHTRAPTHRRQDCENVPGEKEGEDVTG